MLNPLDTIELMQREQDRECRRNFGFGYEEIPPMLPGDAGIRAAAIDARNAIAYSGRKPTYRQLQKIERYLEVARRYWALAKAEFEMSVREIEKKIAVERGAGTYQEPGIRQDLAAMSCLCAVVAMALIGNVLFGHGSALLLLAVATAFSVLGFRLYNVKELDPRIAAAKWERDKVLRYWR